MGKSIGKINVRRESFKKLLLGVVIILAINMLGSRYFTRIDLTAEKRFTLTEATRQTLSDLDDIVYFRVYLEGDFPAGFKRLRNQTREMLDEFRAWTPHVQYEFINPARSGDRERTEANYRELMEKGLSPTQLQVRSDDASSQQIVFPGAIITYQGQEIPVQLLKDQRGMPPEQVLNNSEQALEYQLASAIHRITRKEKPVVAFLEGNGELEFRDLASITFELEEYYRIRRLRLDGKPNALDDVSTLVVAKPTKEFKEEDKFVIDQFIMRGGSVLWLIDPVYASMDSLQLAPETIGMAWPVNLDDMLFRYGARLNAVLLQDLQCLPIPITTGMAGNRPQISLVPWVFFPLVGPAAEHPLVNNVSGIITQFVSSIDTIAAEGIDKTILLQTSPYTRTLRTPTQISFDIMQHPPDEALFREGPQAVAALMEGNFQSVFAHRKAPIASLPHNFVRRDEGQFAKQIVVADGDMIRNSYSRQGEPLPLGYNPHLNETFDNGDFIMNAINYLTGDAGIIEARAREVRMRLLDRSRVNKNRIFIQVFNVALPVVLLLGFAFVRFYLRKRKYGRSALN